jgi:flagellar FliL protein
MADEDNAEKQEQRQPEDAKAEPSKGSLLPWIITGAIVVISAGAGLGLGRLFGSSGTAETARPAEQTEIAHTDALRADGSTADSERTWYYDLEPVIANLDEPGVTRFVRVTLTLELSAELDQKKSVAFIQEKTPLLKNWLTIYLAGQSLENIRGDRNLRRVQSEILDYFNEKLFPDAKSQIKQVLFKEFAIQ